MGIEARLQPRLGVGRCARFPRRFIFCDMGPVGGSGGGDGGD